MDKIGTTQFTDSAKQTTKETTLGYRVYTEGRRHLVCPRRLVSRHTQPRGCGFIRSTGLGSG